MDEITIKDFWNGLGARALSATIVTSNGGEGPAGFVALSATHFSASPPLMTVAASRSTTALQAILDSGIFAINFLSVNGRDVYERFAARDAPKGAERFSGLAWNPGTSGAPVFEAVTGYVECRLDGRFERDDTTLIFGRVLAMHRNPDARPLIHFAGAVSAS